MKTKLFAVIFFISCLSNVYALNPAGLNRFVSDKGLEYSSISFVLSDLASGNVLLSLNEKKGLVPASVTKIVTTATALELYGADFRFETSLALSGRVDGKGVLNGDLVIRGNGDPTLGSDQFPSVEPKVFIDDWVRAVKRAGIKQVNGAVVVDNSIYGDEAIPGKWLWEDMGNYYAAGVWGVNVFDNHYRLTLQSGLPGTTPKILHVEPAVVRVSFENLLSSKNNSKDSAYIYGEPYNPIRRIYGSIPANREKFVIKGDIPNPPLTAANYLKEALGRAGIRVEEESRVMNLPVKTEGEALSRHRSVPLGDICRVLNHKSFNLYADALMRLIAQKSPQGNGYHDGARLARDYWQKHGIDTKSLKLYDGSGLSPSNRISAKCLHDLLIYMDSRGKARNAFLASLPVGGKEGTVKSMFVGTVLDGKVRLKSGSMNGVLCYAGYIEGQKSRYAFVIMVNDFDLPHSALRKKIEQLLLGTEL